MESEAAKTQRLSRLIAELERTLAQKQLEIDYLNKLVEIADKELGTDLKNNLDPKS